MEKQLFQPTDLCKEWSNKRWLTAPTRKAEFLPVFGYFVIILLVLHIITISACVPALQVAAEL